MTNFEDLTSEQKLRLSIHRCARSVTKETAGRFGLSVTSAAADLISELVYKKLKIYGADLDAFAKHAKRNTVNSEDVKLLVRRNPSLKSHISSLPESTAVPAKKRKTLPSAPAVSSAAPDAAPNAEPVPEATSVPLVNDRPETNASTSKDDQMDISDVIDLTFTCSEF